MYESEYEQMKTWTVMGAAQWGWYDGDTVASLSSSCQATSRRHSVRHLVLTERIRAPAPAPLAWRAIVVLVRPAHVGRRTPTHPGDGCVPLLNGHGGGGRADVG